MSKLVPELVCRFDFELPDELAAPNARWKTSNYWFVKAVNFQVRVKLRDKITCGMMGDKRFD